MDKGQKSVIIRGMGYYLPEKVVTNADLVKIVDTSDEWIRTRTGIAERRFANVNEASSDLAFFAAEKALKNANLRPDEIDLIVVATMTPDMIFPSTAALLQARLGMRNVMAFDINAACSGFLYALEVGTQMLRNASYRRALIVGAEKLSSIVNWEDRTTCVLFGDAAGVFVLEKVDAANCGILDGVFGADGSNPEVLYMPAGGSRCPTSSISLQEKQHFIRMNGKELFKVAVRWMEKAIEDLLERNHLSKDAIACLIPHQANIRIIESLAQRLNLPLERVYCNIDKVGNTSAASIPVALAEAYEKNYIRSGDYLVLVAFGAGLTWGATLIKWP